MPRKFTKYQSTGEHTNIAIILAGGVGSRFGAVDSNGNRCPKQFVDVLGKPLIYYTISIFQSHPEIDCIEVVCVESHIDTLKTIVDSYNLDKVKWIVAGGKTFQESVYHGLINLNDKIDPNDNVIVQYGASPFTSNEIISDSIYVCNMKGNAISATDFYLLIGKKRLVESVKCPDNYAEGYIDRDGIACMNTPHSFKYGYIYDLYERASKSGLLEKVEPHTTSLMFAMGEKIYFSLGSQCNIKVTTQEDLELFKGYLMIKTSQ